MQGNSGEVIDFELVDSGGEEVLQSRDDESLVSSLRGVAAVADTVGDVGRAQEVEDLLRGAHVQFLLPRPDPCAHRVVGEAEHRALRVVQRGRSHQRDTQMRVEGQVLGRIDACARHVGFE